MVQQSGKVHCSIVLKEEGAIHWAALGALQLDCIGGDEILWIHRGCLLHSA